jgi:hypothetical protein
MMQTHGACHCGAIRFKAKVDPGRVVICHCADCQVFSGAPFRTSVLVAGDAFELTQGTPAIYEKRAESGALRQLAFCRECGTHVYGTTPGNGASTSTSTFSVRVGVLAERSALLPVAQVWCRSAVPWLGELATIRRIDQQ